MEPAGLTAAKHLVVWAGARVVPGFVTKDNLKIPLGGSWQKNATKDFAVLEGWWNRWPYAWVGVVGGPDSVCVLDADGPEAVDWLRDFICDNGGWEQCSGAWVYKTPGRGAGIHILMKWPSCLDPDFGQAKIRLGDGEVQLRGRGHFTLVAGARRPDGVYTILQEPVNVEEAPTKLILAFLELAEASPAGRGMGELREISPEDAFNLGQITDGRKNFVACLAWHVAVRGGSEEEVYDVCRRFNEEICQPPLPDGLISIKARYAVERAEKARRQNEQAIRTVQNIYRKFS